MTCITLVCTQHEERGPINVEELNTIFVRLQPEVIFLEAPPEAFDEYYETCHRNNLESRTIKLYRETHQVELVPVDIPTPVREFFEDHEYLHNQIRGTSRDYRELLRINENYSVSYGFPYLNSKYCSSLWSDIYREMFNTIKKIEDIRLLEIFNLWKKTNELREQEMLRNIQAYCISNTFDRGVFLVGAAHRQGIIDKSKEQSLASLSNVEWQISDWLP